MNQSKSAKSKESENKSTIIINYKSLSIFSNFIYISKRKFLIKTIVNKKFNYSFDLFNYF